ncbi:hypothetical protein L1049_016711 [Liquidambar formosana]|uniref:At3g05675-like ankyrin-like domain-containing protein n=1 Tax=Liquidambar formosana TaxID=63359 RepID=A0AAP0RZM9_LIQFO
MIRLKWFEDMYLGSVMYLEAIPWSKDEEEKVMFLLSQLQLHESMTETILTLPVQQQQQQALLLNLFGDVGRFRDKGDDSPNIQRAFEVFWRRAYADNMWPTRMIPSYRLPSVIIQAERFGVRWSLVDDEDAKKEVKKGHMHLGMFGRNIMG